MKSLIYDAKVSKGKEAVAVLHDFQNLSKLKNFSTQIF